MITDNEKHGQVPDYFKIAVYEINPLQGRTAIAKFRFTENDIKKIVERFEREETVITKTGKRVADPFRKLIRKHSGLKEDYTQLTFAEKSAEAGKKIARDFMIAREEIRTRNPVDYFLDRALDPLDPMGVVYTVMLEKMGATVNEQTKAITLSPELKKILNSNRREIDMERLNVAEKLPDFKGYSVDERLKEFRKMEYGKMPELISFDSHKGQKLLKEMTNQNLIEQSLRNPFTAKVTRVNVNRETGTAQITMKSHGGQLKLTVKEPAAQNIKAGMEVAIVKHEAGLTIKALKPGVKNLLKR